MSEAGEDVGEGLAVRVVAVEGEAGGGDEPGDGGQHGLHGAGGRHADRVPQRDLVAAHLVQPGRHARHLLGLDGALVGAARHAGHVAAHRHAVCLGRGHHRLEPGEALLYRAVDVLLAATSDHQMLQFNLYTQLPKSPPKGLAGSSKDCHLRCPAFHGSLVTLGSWMKRGKAQEIFV